MALLYYWRPDNYSHDRAFGFGYHLNQNNALLTSMREGDSLWAFTRRRGDGLYVLAAEPIVRAVTSNVPHYRYGNYRVWGDLELVVVLPQRLCPHSRHGDYSSESCVAKSIRESGKG